MSLRTTRLSHIFFCLIISSQMASAQHYLESPRIPIQPVQIASEFADRGDGVLWSTRISEPSAFYIRLHFSDISSPESASYEVIVRDRGEKVIARYLSAEFGKKKDFLTGPLFTSRITVEVVGTRTAGLKFELDYYLREQDSMGRVIAEGTLPNWRSPESVPKIVEAAVEPLLEAVAKIYTGNGYVCTGFLISERAVLTNYHCIATSTMFSADGGPKKSKCEDVALQFDFNTQSEPRNSVSTSCRSVMAYDEGVDYALLEVNPTEIFKGGSRRKFLKLRGSKSPDIEEVLVIHHPAGLSAKVSFGCLSYSNRTPGLVEHDCSTVGGSSGAPLLAYDGTVVGLHHDSGVPESMTFGDLRKALEGGQVFLNKAVPASELSRVLASYLP